MKLWSENTRTIHEESTQSSQIQDTFAMNTSTKVVLIAIGMLGLLGAGSIARAEQQQEQINILLECPLLHVIKTTDENNKINDDAVQVAKLKSLAKINAQQAQQAAEAAQNGKTSSIELEAENGNLVYIVIIGKNEVEVDAGNGKVLYIDRQANEKAEENHSRSSIQVFQGGDSKNYDNKRCN